MNIFMKMCDAHILIYLTLPYSLRKHNYNYILGCFFETIINKINESKIGKNIHAERTIKLL